MIEACPPPGSAQQQPSNSYNKHHPNTMNNVIRILLRKGLVVDLARIPHSLDLSSPNMAATVNSALKPLETLSRVVNQPSTSALGKTVIKPRAGGRTALQSSGLSRNVAGKSLSFFFLQFIISTAILMTNYDIGSNQYCRPDTSQRQRRQLPSCPMVNAFPVENVQFPHRGRGPLPRRKCLGASALSKTKHTGVNPPSLNLLKMIGLLMKL